MKEIVKCNECKHHFLNGGDCAGVIILSKGSIHDIVELKFCSHGEKADEYKNTQKEEKEE